MNPFSEINVRWIIRILQIVIYTIPRGEKYRRNCGFIIMQNLIYMTFSLKGQANKLLFLFPEGLIFKSFQVNLKYKGLMLNTDELKCRVYVILPKAVIVRVVSQPYLIGNGKLS